MFYLSSEAGVLQVLLMEVLVGPDIFPFILGIMLVSLSIRLFYETFIGKTRQGTKEKLQYKPFLIILLPHWFIF